MLPPRISSWFLHGGALFILRGKKDQNAVWDSPFHHVVELEMPWSLVIVMPRQILNMKREFNKLTTCQQNCNFSIPYYSYSSLRKEPKSANECTLSVSLSVSVVSILNRTELKTKIMSGQECFMWLRYFNLPVSPLLSQLRPLFSEYFAQIPTILSNLQFFLNAWSRLRPPPGNGTKTNDPRMSEETDTGCSCRNYANS